MEQVYKPFQMKLEEKKKRKRESEAMGEKVSQ
jgi:hypothetical protein